MRICAPISNALLAAVAVLAAVCALLSGLYASSSITTTANNASSWLLRSIVIAYLCFFSHSRKKGSGHSHKESGGMRYAHNFLLQFHCFLRRFMLCFE